MEPKPGRTPEEKPRTRSEHTRVMDSLEDTLPTGALVVLGRKTQSEDTRALFIKSTDTSGNIDIMTIDGPYRISANNNNLKEGIDYYPVDTPSNLASIDSYGPGRMEKFLNLALFFEHSGIQVDVSGSYTMVDGNPLLEMDIMRPEKPEIKYSISPDPKHEYSISPITMDEFNRSVEEAQKKVKENATIIAKHEVNIDVQEN